MPTSTKVKNLNINELTEAQYDAAVQGGVIGANELSVLTDVSYVEPSDLATVATTGDYSDLINRPTNLVSTNTAQTISGMKTFRGDITLSGTTSIKNNTGGTNYTMLYRDASTIHVGASTSALKLEGTGTRPAYNNDSLALLSDVTAELPSQTGHSGEFLTTDGTSVSWAAVSGGLLPSQTGNSGKFLTTDGTAASWSDVVKQHTIKYDGGDLPAPNGIPVDVLTFAGTKNGSTIYPAKIKLHDSGMNLWGSSADFAVRIEGNLLGNRTIGRNVFGVIDKWNKIFVSKISSGAQDISVPNTTGTMAVIQVNTTATLTAAGWSGGSQTVSVTGMTATGVVMVSPDPTDQSAYTSAGIICSAQAAGTLTFTCSTTPSADLSVNVVML